MPKEPPQQKKSNLMIKDEVCNTYLPVEDAIEVNINGKKYYFCSKECKEKFIEEYKKGFLKKP
ncbi:YHS domain-containing protein [Candidatus Aminicenantes bacterium AC-335-A11]|nr:YHS domain-containing protein [Candidatus Aminicenantes bacterium AC-335-L06]MCP2618147.1 YHS domain-containing protein [Candidatus Aminicenantes bacterium AC-335-A11]